MTLGGKRGRHAGRLLAPWTGRGHKQSFPLDLVSWESARSCAGTGGNPASLGGVGYSLEKTVFPGHVLPAEARCQDSFEVECKALKTNQRPNALQPPLPRPCPPEGFLCRPGSFPESMEVCVSVLFSQGASAELWFQAQPPGWAQVPGVEGLRGGWVVSGDPAGGRERACGPGAHVPQLPWARPGPVHGKAL